MICPKCSQVVPDGSRFCTECGTSLEEVVADVETAEAVAEEVVDESSDASEEDEDASRDMSQEVAAAQQALGAASMSSEQVPVTESVGQGVATAAGTAVKASAGISKPLLFGLIGGGAFLAVAAVVLVVVGVIISNKKTTINLPDYTVVNYEGVDGYGRASLEVDEDKLARDVAESMGLDVDELKSMSIAELIEVSGKNAMDIQKLYLAVTSIDVELDKDSGLSNGDKITITYSFDEEKAADAKVEFVGDVETRTVQGLDAVKEVDPFTDVTVEFGGVSPQAYISITNNNKQEPLNFIYFDYDKSTGLSVGDTVTVKVSGYDEEEFIENYGVKFTQTEKKYTVEGVDEYITSADQLDDTALEKMKNATQDYITEYFADSSRKSAIKSSDVKYFGYYFLTNKNISTAWYEYNKIYMVLSAEVSSKEKPKQFKSKTVYFPIEFRDVKKLVDGSWEIDSSYKLLLGSTDLKYGYWSTVSGYTSLKELKNDLVDADAANFTAEGYDGLAG